VEPDIAPNQPHARVTYASKKDPIGEPQTAGLLAIAAFKLFHAILLLLAGLAAIRLMHRDVEQVARTILHHIRADPDGKHVRTLLAKVTGVSPRKLELLGVGAFIYSALYFIEGIGLLLAKRWAEWMAVITTGGFVPLEIYEVIHHPHAVRIIVLIINVAIVVYLIKELRRKSGKQSAAAHA
jgi:uncharacterized membrane protein (DUF2068 family)